MIKIYKISKKKKEMIVNNSSVLYGIVWYFYTPRNELRRV